MTPPTLLPDAGSQRPAPAPGPADGEPAAAAPTAAPPAAPTAAPPVRRSTVTARRLTRAWPTAAALVLALGAWELAVRLSGVSPWFLPAPSQVASAGGELAPGLGPHLTATLGAAVAGLALGSAAGVAVALALAASDLLNRALLPLLVATQSIPMIVLAPLLAVWFGFGLTPKVLVVCLVVFFPVAVGTAEALRGADPGLVAWMRTLGARRSQVLWHVRVPSALPATFAGMQVGAAYAVMAAVVAEWIGTEHGLGMLITRAQRSFRADRVLAVVAVVAVASVVLVAAVRLAARLVLRWQAPAAGARS